MDKREFMELMLGMSLALKKWAPDFTDQATLRAWYQMLGDIEPEKLRMACKKAILTLDEFPSIAKIIRITKGTNLSDEEIGQDIASRIEGAVSSIGHCLYESTEEGKARHHKRLLDKVGPIGMEVIRMAGGWNHICGAETDELMSLRKQWRELATVVSKRLHASGENKAPELPEGSRVEKPKALQAALDLVTIGRESTDNAARKITGYEMEKPPRTNWDAELKKMGSNFNPVYEPYPDMESINGNEI
jgi:hypothetical protein